MNCCAFETNGESGDAGGSVSIVNVDPTVYEVDFAEEPVFDFVNGVRVIDGRSWTVFSRAAASVYGTDGNGIRWRPALATAGVFNETNQTAAGMYIDLATLIGPTFHPAKRYSFELHYSSRTLNASTRIGPFLWGPAGLPTGAVSRVRGGGVNNSAGTQLPFSQQTATATNGTENVGTHDVFAVTVEPVGTVFASSGIYGPEWPTSMSQQVWSSTNFAATSPAANRADTRLVLTHSHNAQNPIVDDVTLRRLRVVEL